MSTIKVDTIATRTGSGTITVSNDLAVTGLSTFSSDITVTESNANASTDITILNANGVATVGNQAKLHLGTTNSGSHGASIIGEFTGTANTNHATDLIFKTTTTGSSLTEAARIDNAGNLIVGTTNNNPTSSGVNVAGQSFGATGGVRSTVDQNPSATFNRKTDDGQIVLFRKDGTTVGSINVMSGDNLAIASTSADHAGIMLGGHSIIPMEANAQADGTINLGSSTKRFQNLILSGGVKLGGTGTANTLDDYEEGTFVPKFSFGGGNSGQNYAIRTGFYTKVGRQVHFTLRLELSARGSSTGAITIDDLPFTTLNTTHSENSAYVGFIDSVSSNFDTNNLTLVIGTNGTSINVRRVNSGASGEFSHSDFGNSSQMVVSGSYMTP